MGLETLVAGINADGAAQLDLYGISCRKAYSFLGGMMDVYARGSTLRGIPSYSDQQRLEATAFTYDNALALHAFLVRGTAADLARALVLGDALLHAQRNERARDGRLRQAYLVDARDRGGAYLRPSSRFSGSHTGDLAWAGMALAQLYLRTRASSHLAGAVGLATWIFDHTFDGRGAGGYSGGCDAQNLPVTYKATEHNIDAYALFRMLAQLTRPDPWLARARHALSFVEAMWNPNENFFWTGTGSDGIAINTSNIPEDVQTWSCLASPQRKYAASLDWAARHLATVDTPESAHSRLPAGVRVAGLTFASQSLLARTPSSPDDDAPDPNAVWLEGTAHAAAALLARRSFDDSERALSLLASIRLAQSALGDAQTVAGRPIQAGEGVVAASSVCDSGFGSSYYPNLHIGATAWYLIAAQAANPFELGYRLARRYSASKLSRAAAAGPFPMLSSGRPCT